ncbi:NAD-dependent epimerase/dehydratase family protein [Lysobacter soli]|uniref:NAD-dependent epimerase/dehydratase family protein n=1 Tax=Lysobacter soli TaxID=453783 RepID=UPI0037CBBC13
MSEEVAMRALSRVIVTGAGGFLGRALSDRLEREGIEVLRLGRGNGFRLLEDELPLDGVDHVFHLAAETGVPDAWKDPARFHLVNAHGTVRVLDQCRRGGVSVTYVGAYIYGAPKYLPIDEQHPVDANNPYAFSKLMAEEAAQWYANLYGMAVTSIRLFNVYGPGQSDRFLIPRIVKQVCDIGVGQIELMDLAPRRDYLFVGDAVEALLKSVPRPGFQLYNVGSGFSHSVREVVDATFELAGVVKPVVDHGQTRPNEIPDVVCDHGRITAETGWVPRTSLKEGIALMIQEERS